ncbi:MAG TPA: D-erythronate dehydrogenase [Geminicoccaceae bacterium]|nr:D-erythronate dehydrogenase [Geminicoccaceae bacterium]
MRILITGGTGFIGKKLAAALLRQGEFVLDGGAARAIERLTLFDAFPGEGVPEDPRVELVTGDIADRSALDRLVRDADLVWHLAAIVSANAEADFDLGMRVNLDGTRHLLEALRATGRRPRLVFSSTLAVYGGEMPEVITDATHLTPQTSYGTQKAIGELLVADYSRKGFVDGRSLRLPTIVVRPGKPNKAASAFASSILREPLAGIEVSCPVGPETAMFVLSPRRVVQALLHAMRLPEEAWGMTRMLQLPGITVTVRESVEALRRVGGDHLAARVRFEPDPFIQKIVAGWAARAETPRALAMGFEADRDIDEIVRAHIEDELGGKVAA